MQNKIALVATKRKVSLSAQLANLFHQAHLRVCYLMYERVVTQEYNLKIDTSIYLHIQLRFRHV